MINVLRWHHTEVNCDIQFMLKFHKTYQLRASSPSTSGLRYFFLSVCVCVCLFVSVSLIPFFYNWLLELLWKYLLTVIAKRFNVSLCVNLTSCDLRWPWAILNLGQVSGFSCHMYPVVEYGIWNSIIYGSVLLLCVHWSIEDVEVLDTSNTHGFV